MTRVNPSVGKLYAIFTDDALLFTLYSITFSMTGWTVGVGVGVGDGLLILIVSLHNPFIDKSAESAKSESLYLIINLDST